MTTANLLLRSNKITVKHFEFWSPRFFEAPYYLYLLALCAKHRLAPKFLAKANYALDHGEIGIGSKLETQLAFDQRLFLPSILLEASDNHDHKVAAISKFAAEHQFPVILKPDMGCVGKGVIKVSSQEETLPLAATLTVDYILQKYTHFKQEFGVFFVRHGGRSFISGINKKHFPTVVGDSERSLQQLAEAHPRFTAHWDLFLQYVDRNHVPEAGEIVQLSFIGSHTMGCKFTNDSELNTPALEQAISQIAASQPGFNFGRLDVKAESTAEFQAGHFVVIEVNGAASLPTHMFDPSHSLAEGYRIFFEHARHLALAANEQRTQPMNLLPLLEVLRKAKQQQAILNQAHQTTLQRG